jgi:hypothetical protein
MTEYKILGQNSPIANTNTVFYTVPASKSALVRAINVTNTSSTPDTFDISITLDSSASIANEDYIFKSQQIFGNETITIKGGYTMQESNTFRIRSTNGTSTFHAFGGEI